MLLLLLLAGFPAALVSKPAKKPNVVILFAGANDVHRQATAG
jgi:hypothetical protein